MKDLCNYPSSRIDTKCVFLKKQMMKIVYPFRNIREDREGYLFNMPFVSLEFTEPVKTRRKRIFRPWFGHSAQVQ